MVIVEGPDGAGKSTLVKQIAKRFELRVGARGVADRDKLWQVTRPDTYKAVIQAIRPNQPPQVWDRLFFSELVYWDLVGDRECQFNDAEQELFQSLIGALHAPVILCMPPLETVRSNITKDKQMAGVADNIDRIWGDYWALVNDDVFPDSLIIYNYEEDDVEDLMDDVEDYISLKKARER